MRWQDLTLNQQKRIFYRCVLKEVLPRKCKITECKNCGVVSAQLEILKERNKNETS